MYPSLIYNKTWDMVVPFLSTQKMIFPRNGKIDEKSCHIE